MVSPPLRLLREPREAGATAFVLVHPVTGDARVYRAFAEHLVWRGPVIGIDALQPTTSLPRLAADYIEALREQLPGRWCLGGWAVGGVIAAEMAAQLVDAGEPPVAVAIFDARAPQPEMRNRPMDDLALARNFADVIARNAGRDVTRKPERADGDELIAVLRDSGAAPESWDSAIAAGRFAVFASIVRAFFAHEQQRIDVPVALFETQESHPQHPKPPTLGWEPYARTLVRSNIRGTHFSLMSEQHAPSLAAVVDDALAGIMRGP